MAKKTFNRETFLSAMSKPNIAQQEVFLPDLGGSVMVREMNGTVRNRVESAYAAIQAGGEPKALDDAMIQLLSVCTLDEAGSPLMTPNEAKRFIATQPRAAYKIRDVAMELSAHSDEDLEAMSEVFGEGRNEDSTSG